MARADHWTLTPQQRRWVYAAGALGCVVLLVVIAVRFWWPADSEAAGGPSAMRRLHVGDCLIIEPRPDKGRGANGGVNITHRVVDCGALEPRVVYRVESLVHGDASCANPNLQQYWEDNDDDPIRPRLWTSCLRPKLQVGQCYGPDPVTKAFSAMACGPDALLRVDSETKRGEGVVCPAESEAYAFPGDDPITYCVRVQD